MRNIFRNLIVTSPLLLNLACNSRLTSEEEQVERGRRIFFEETFQGNGRTCGTCHRPEDNFKITPEFMATLPPDDPLFVAEFVTLPLPLLSERALRGQELFLDVEHQNARCSVCHINAGTSSLSAQDALQLAVFELVDETESESLSTASRF